MFMTMDKMERIMRSGIVLHSRSVEFRIQLGEEADYSDEEDDSVSLGAHIRLIWAGLVRTDGENINHPEMGSLAALCESRSFIGDESEHYITNSSLVKHFGKTVEVRPIDCVAT